MPEISYRQEYGRWTKDVISWITGHVAKIKGNLGRLAAVWMWWYIMMRVYLSSSTLLNICPDIPISSSCLTYVLFTRLGPLNWTLLAVCYSRFIKYITQKATGRGHLSFLEHSYVLRSLVLPRIIFIFVSLPRLSNLCPWEDLEDQKVCLYIHMYVWRWYCRC